MSTDLQAMGIDPAMAWLWGQRIVTAAVILLVAWVLARSARWAFARLVDRVPVMKRASGTGESLGESLGKIVGLLIWLFALVAVLQVFALDAVIAPLRALLDQVMGFVPRLVGAALIFFVGLMIAKIVRQLVETSLATVDFDRWMGRAGTAEVTGTHQLVPTIGTIVYALVVIPIAIAALDTLALRAISVPASQMLTMVLDAVPLIVGAALVLAIGYFIARWVTGLIESVLPNLGVDRALGAMGLLPAGIAPSRLIATIATVAIMLFAGIAATRMLNFPELSAILDQLLELGGRVIFGSIVIGVGVVLANMIARLIARSTGEHGVVPMMIRYVIIAVATFMGLTFMQIGQEVVIIAFTGFIFAVSVASALAFGLGGREAAAQTLADMRADAKARAVAAPVENTAAPVAE